MPEIAIRLDPDRLDNPDLDVRYELPSRLELVTQGRVQDDAYDYDESNRLLVFLLAPDVKAGLSAVLEALKSIEVLGNRFHDAVVAVAETDHCEDLARFRIVHPAGLEGTLAST